MLRVFGCMCMALVPKHLRHNKFGAKAIWAVHLSMAQNSKGWLLWDPFTKKFLVSRDCKFMENLMYKDWKAENEARIGVRFGEVKSSGLEHVDLPLELSIGSTTTRQSSLVNGGEEAKDAEEEEEEVQQVSEHEPTLPSRTTSAPRIHVTPQQRHESLHVPAAEEEGRGKRRIQAPNMLTYDALEKPAKSALAGVAMMVGEDEESEYKEFAFAIFSPVEMPGELATLKENLESSDVEEWKKAMESELKSIEENGTSLLEGAAIKGWVVKQMDVTTAFLNDILEEEIFLVQPEGFDDGSGRVWKLKKAFYGLKQAPRQWYLKLREVLEEISFTPSTANHSLFMLGEGEKRSFMVVYVDDILIFSPSFDLVNKFKCKALGDVNFYLRLHIERDVEKRCMRVHQRKYLEALAAKFGQSEGHVATPFPSGLKCVKGTEEESVGEEERRRFHSVGSLMYAAVNTRPDVVFATGQLARVVQCPNEEKIAAGMRVAKYLGQTPTVGLQYSAAAQRRQKGADGVGPGRLFLTAFSDASYASEPEDMTSVGGFICCVGGGPTAWERKKQVDQALRSVESEYMALFRAAPARQSPLQPALRSLAACPPPCNPRAARLRHAHLPCSPASCPCSPAHSLCSPAPCLCSSRTTLAALRPASTAREPPWQPSALPLQLTHRHCSSLRPALRPCSPRATTAALRATPCGPLAAPAAPPTAPSPLAAPCYPLTTCLRPARSPLADLVPASCPCAPPSLPAITSLCHSGGSGDGGGGSSGSGGGHTSSRCGAVRWGVFGVGQMQLQWRLRESLPPQQLREWYASRSGGGGSSGSHCAAVQLGVSCGGLEQLQWRPRETLTVVPKYYSGTVIALPFNLQACSASGILWGGA
ncbi:unnamed protein product [Closterium sp. NIES-53]